MQTIQSFEREFLNEKNAELEPTFRVLVSPAVLFSS